MVEDSTTPVSSLLYGLARLLFVPYLKLNYRITVKGEANVPATGPLVVLSKHQRWLDIPVVGFALGRPLRYVAKSELFVSSSVGSILKGLGGIPLDRKAPIRTLESFRLLSRLLLIGERIVVFPEGTYYPGRIGRGKWRLIQWVLEFQGRAGLLIPFIPMGIRYGDERLRPGIDVRIGSPLYESDASRAVSFTSKAMEEIGKLSGLGAKGRHASWNL
jgi:1-acyl-sn-glycerol-3-phosphate acyltransferase